MPRAAQRCSQAESSCPSSRRYAISCGGYSTSNAALSTVAPWAAAFITIASDAPKTNPTFKLAVSIVPHNARNPRAKPFSLAAKIW